MVIEFGSALILDSRFGTSKAGNPWASLSFLDQSTLNVYNVMCFGDAVAVAAGLAKGGVVSLTFEVSPDRDSGVRLMLVGVGRVD